MTKYKSHYFLLLLAFLYSTYGAAVPEENKSTITTVHYQNVQMGNLLKLSINNNSILQVNRDDRNILVNNKDTATQNQDTKTDTLELQADQQRNDDIEAVTESDIILTGNRETPTPTEIEKKGMQNESKVVQNELKLIHEEFRDVPLEEIELPFYTKPMQPDTTEKQVNLATKTFISGVKENVNMLTQNETTTGENQAVQQLNEDKKHLIKENTNKDYQIKKLEAEKNQLVKKIIDSIDVVVNNTGNVSEKKDLKELKTMIKFLGNVENSKENTRDNIQATERPAGLLSKVIAARKAGQGGESVNLFGPENMDSFSEVMQRGKHIGREYVEYTTRDIEKEKDRKEKHRGKVQKNLDAWLKDRELLHPSIPDELTTRKFIEKCENWGWTRDKYKNIIVRPCCKLCCRKSYLGCK